MEVLLVDRGETAEMVLTGGLGTGTADEVLRICSEATREFRNIVLNLSELRYVSSAGLDMIKQLYMTVCQNGGKLELYNVSPTIMEVLEMTGFASFLRITQRSVFSV